MRLSLLRLESRMEDIGTLYKCLVSGGSIGGGSSDDLEDCNTVIAQDRQVCPEVQTNKKIGNRLSTKISRKNRWIADK